MRKFWNRKKGKSEVVKCPVCSGSGKVGESGEKCASCGGSGVVMTGEIARAINIQSSNSTSSNQNYQRNMNDIQLVVAEGLSGTWQIAVSAWSKDDALDLFTKVRTEMAAKK